MFVYDFFWYNFIRGGDTLIIGVLVQLSNKNIDKVFDYSVPSELQDMIKIGIRVEVPFGKQVLEGFVLEIKNYSELDVKDILSIKDEEVILNDELLELGKLQGKLKEIASKLDEEDNPVLVLAKFK